MIYWGGIWRDVTDFLMVVLVVFMFLTGATICALSFRSCEVKYIKNVPTYVFIEGKLMYNGPSAGVEITSAGMATQVKTYLPPLYLAPDRIYVSKDVVVVGERKANDKR